MIGAGFSGLLTTLHLLSDPDGPQVRLIERDTQFGRGRAFHTVSADHVLNVRAGNMSAFPDDPDHFRRWLAQGEGGAGGDVFVTRERYGDYLQTLLREAVAADGRDRLLLENDQAVRLEPAADGWIVHLAMGRQVRADVAILALGLLPAHPLAGADEALLKAPAYEGDPWRGLDRIRAAGVQGDVLLVGAGLTMVDAALALRGDGRRLIAISRRGLTPQTHGVVRGLEPQYPLAASPLAMLQAVRDRSALVGWRQAVDELRPTTQALWRSWTPADRGRFLRHLRPWWDIHRHRMAPAVAGQLAALQAAGDLTVRAGRISRLRLQPDGVRAWWRPRGERRESAMTVQAVVNCTGVQGDLQRSGQPLIVDLLAAGLIRPDPCALGADVDEQGRLVSREGRAHPHLYAVGPLTRGAVWEIVAVPDIRLQAAHTARTIGQAFRRA